MLFRSGADASEKLLHIAQGFTEAFASLWLSLHPLDLLLGVAGAALVRLAEGIDLSQKLLHFADGCAAALKVPPPASTSLTC